MDGWIASLSDGSTHEEEWLPGYVSPWQRLMQYCAKNKCYIEQLRLDMGGESINIKQALGYWQAHGQNAIQGLQQDEELDKIRGIGFVTPDRRLVEIYWGTYDPIEHKPTFWIEHREAQGQNQIIWSKV